MAVMKWNGTKFVEGKIERRSKERTGIIEQFVTITNNALRKHMPEIDCTR